MIKLYVEDYCQTCPDFSPDIERTRVWAGTENILNTNVFCSYKDRCEQIAKRFEKEVKDGDIVKCENCIHHASFLPWCKKHDAWMNDEDYCSKGE